MTILVSVGVVGVIVGLVVGVLFGRKNKAVVEADLALAKAALAKAGINL